MAKRKATSPRRALIVARLFGLPDLSTLTPPQLIAMTTVTHAWCLDGVARLIGTVETEDWSGVLNTCDALLRGRLGTVEGFAPLYEQIDDDLAVGHLLILRFVLGVLGQEFKRRTARGPA